MIQTYFAQYTLCEPMQDDDGGGVYVRCRGVHGQEAETWKRALPNRKRDWGWGVYIYISLFFSFIYTK